MDLAIVIVSYNTCALTRACLQSVYAALTKESLSAHVWVVDNASADGSAGMVSREFPQACLIASAQNTGFAHGTNLALSDIRDSHDRPRHVLLLNPDTLVEPNALSEMVAHLDAEPRVGAVGAQLAYADGSFQHGAFSFPTLLMAFFDFWTINYRLIDSRLNGRYPRRWYERGTPFAVDHPLGAALMIRHATLEQVGPLDDGYFMYCEEIDWCLRAKRAGWQIRCVPRARIVHLGAQSTSQFRDQMFIALWRSRFRLFHKHYGRGYIAAVRLILRAGLRKRARLVNNALAQGEITPQVAATQLDALRTVGEM